VFNADVPRVLAMEWQRRYNEVRKRRKDKLQALLESGALPVGHGRVSGPLARRTRRSAVAGSAVEHACCALLRGAALFLCDLNRAVLSPAVLRRAGAGWHARARDRADGAEEAQPAEHAGEGRVVLGLEGGGCCGCARACRTRCVRHGHACTCLT
jgi:hypothetical protein